MNGYDGAEGPSWHGCTLIPQSSYAHITFHGAHKGLPGYERVQISTLGEMRTKLEVAVRSSPLISIPESRHMLLCAVEVRALIVGARLYLPKSR